MRRLALRSALSDKMAADGIIVVDGFDVEGGRTKNLLGILAALGAQGTTIIVLPEQNSAVRLASGNLPNVHVALPNGLSVLEVLGASTMIFSRAAVEPVTRLVLGEAPGQAAAA
jgi:large subunit ribosomal protein L4